MSSASLSAPSKTASPVVLEKSASSNGSRGARAAAAPRDQEDAPKPPTASSTTSTATVTASRTFPDASAVHRPADAPVSTGAYPGVRVNTEEPARSVDPDPDELPELAAYSRPATDPLWTARRRAATSAT